MIKENEELMQECFPKHSRGNSKNEIRGHENKEEEKRRTNWKRDARLNMWNLQIH